MKTYIQIGANKGNDDFFEKMSLLNEPSKIVLVEPNTLLIEELTKCYESLAQFHNVIIVNKGVTSDSTLDTLVLYHNGRGEGDDGLSSIISRKTWENVIGSVKFVPISFEKLCEETNVNKEDIEELCIDTEGYDYNILNSIDFSEWKVKKIYSELWPYDEDSSEAIKTGPTFFNETVLPKMSQHYKLSQVIMGGMATHLFERL